MTPGYSHIGEHVSTLYQAGAPNGPWIAASFGVYNVLVLAFGVAVYGLVPAVGDPRRAIGRAGGIALVLTAIAGLADDVFWQDPVGAPATTAGTLHIAFAAIASLLTIVTIALVAAWALGRPSLRRFGWYSVVTLLVIAVFGPVTAVATANLWPMMGLLERIPILGFIRWVAIGSIVLARWAVAARPMAGRLGQAGGT